MKSKRTKPPRLPVQQLIILSICRIAEPVVLTSVFPYLPEMMEYLGVETRQVAFYAGLTTSVFSLCQCLTGVPWGRASDRFGRKPVILTGMTCTMITSIMFGSSRSLPWAITARAIAGLGNGNVGTIRTMVAEMVPQKELQPRAFSIMPLIWVIGSIFGPSFGGFFANPTKRWGWHNAFFETYPYLLPNLIASVLFLVGLTTGFLFLHETLSTRKHRKDYGLALGKRLTRPIARSYKEIKHHYTDPEAAPLLDPSPSSSTTHVNGTTNGKAGDKPVESTKPPGYSEVFQRQSCINLLAYTLLALHSVAFDQLLPIFMHHPLQDHSPSNPDIHYPLKFAGGFGLDSNGIGLVFTCYGVFGMLGQFLVYPPVARRFGILNCLKVCSLMFPIIYMLAPFTVLFETNRGRHAAILVLMACKSLATVHSFSSSTILLTNSASSLRILGTLNGFATSFSAMGRAAGPAIGGSTFSLGVDRGYLIVPWWTIAAFAIIGSIPIWWLVESEGFGGDEDEEEESEDRESSPSSSHPSSDNEDEDALLSESETERELEAQKTVSARPSRGFLRSKTTPVSTHPTTTEEAIEDEDLVPDEPLSRVSSVGARRRPGSSSAEVRPHHAHGGRGLHRTISNPIFIRGSIGPDGKGRRLSTNLGSSNNGLGVGGTSWN